MTCRFELHTGPGTAEFNSTLDRQGLNSFCFYHLHPGGLLTTCFCYKRYVRVYNFFRIIPLICEFSPDKMNNKNGSFELLHRNLRGTSDNYVW